MVGGIRSVAKTKAINYELVLLTPAKCAKAAIEKSTDIALVPVGSLPQITDYQIITDYCISATGVVDTVALLSNTPLAGITKIYLDSESRTSVLLCRVLCRELWGIEPEFIDEIPAIEGLKTGEAVMAIGDKVFDMEGEFRHKTDLSEGWQQLTGMPFVFAVWVALSHKGVEGAEGLNNAIKYGVENIEKWLPYDDPLRPRNLHYLTHRIEYELTPQKHSAITLFLNKIKSLETR